MTCTFVFISSEIESIKFELSSFVSMASCDLAYSISTISKLFESFKIL